MYNYEIDFVKIFIPKLSYLDDTTIKNFINSKYQYLKKNNIMLSRRDFRSGYPDFNLNIYYIFNDDIKDFNELQIKYHWHINGKNLNKISTLRDFFQRYKDFDNDSEIILRFCKTQFKFNEGSSSNPG